MSAKAISEQTGKEFLYKNICTSAAVQNRFRYASVTAETDWDRLTQEHPWLLTEVTASPNSGRSLNPCWKSCIETMRRLIESLRTPPARHYVVSIITAACDREFCWGNVEMFTGHASLFRLIDFDLLTDLFIWTFIRFYCINLYLTQRKNWTCNRTPENEDF